MLKTSQKDISELMEFILETIPRISPEITAAVAEHHYLKAKGQTNLSVIEYIHNHKHDSLKGLLTLFDIKPGDELISFKNDLCWYFKATLKDSNSYNLFENFVPNCNK